MIQPIYIPAHIVDRVAIAGDDTVVGPKGRAAFTHQQDGRTEWLTSTPTTRAIRNIAEAVQYAAEGFLESVGQGA